MEYNAFMDTFIIFGAKYLYLVAIAIAVLYFLSSRRKKGIVLFGIIDLVLTYIVAKVLNHFIINPRPFVSEHVIPLIPHAPDNGFPSDHVLLVSAIAGVLFCYNRKAGVAVYVLAILIGISRVLAGIHHWVDVIGSLVIAIAVTVVVYLFTRKRLIISQKPHHREGSLL